MLIVSRLQNFSSIDFFPLNLVSAFVDMLSTLTHPEMINDIVHDAIGPDFQLVNPYKFMSEYLHRLKEDAGLRGRVVVPPTQIGRAHV